jgi:hypothetical protein
MIGDSIGLSRMLEMVGNKYQNRYKIALKDILELKNEQG